MDIEAENINNSVLQILREQKDLIERQTIEQAAAAKASALQAIECEKARAADEMLAQINRDRIEFERQHIDIHEEQTLAVIQMMDRLEILIAKMDIVYTEHLGAMNRVILVINLLFSSHRSSMNRETREEIQNLMELIKAGLDRGSVRIENSPTNMNVGRDVVTDGNLEVS